MPPAIRPVVALLTAALLLATPASAFYTPLSDQAVREAYFLGQRHDESTVRVLNSYAKFLPPPQSGPHISSVAFYTPFAQIVQHIAGFTGNYSAQQTVRDHNPDEEVVIIQIEIAFTRSYGPFISLPAGSQPGSPPGYQRRSSDFWKEFGYRVFDNKEEITTTDVTGHGQSNCTKAGCTLRGAVVYLRFPAAAFTSDTATIEVTPREGDPASIDFALATLR